MTMHHEVKKLMDEIKQMMIVCKFVYCLFNIKFRARTVGNKTVHIRFSFIRHLKTGR